MAAAATARKFSELKGMLRTRDLETVSG